MNTIKINEIKIRYDDNQKSQISYIANIIKNNYGLFLFFLGKKNTLSLIPSNEEKCIYISDFNTTFYNIVNNFFNSEEYAKLLNVHSLYANHLIRKTRINNITRIKANTNVTDEILYSSIAYLYFTKTSNFNNFVEYLKEKKDIEKIIIWFENETRFETYNYLLKFTINCLTKYDFEFIDNIDDINNIINMVITKSPISSILLPNEKKITLPSITVQEIDKLFYEFLLYINAPEEWIKTYNELKSNGKIIFEETDDDTNNSKCYYDKFELKILISFNRTIKSFHSLVHEFTHYISLKNETNKTKISIVEFPSIFFEKVSEEFLKNKGYTKEIVDEVKKDRKKNILYAYEYLYPLFIDIITFIKEGPISKSTKVKSFKKDLQADIKINEKLSKSTYDIDNNYLNILDFDISEVIDNECDQLIARFYQGSLPAFDGYQYLLGTYLADEVLKKTAYDNTIISKMINVTNSLSCMTLKTILNEFNINNSFNEFSKHKNAKYRKLTK